MNDPEYISKYTHVWFLSFIVALVYCVFQYGTLADTTVPGKAESRKTISDFLRKFSEINVGFLKTFAKKDKELPQNTLSNIKAYLQDLLQPSFLDSHEGLLELIFNFLEHRIWDRERYPLHRKVISSANPVKENFKHFPSGIGRFWH